jgi:hypothetical protein
VWLNRMIMRSYFVWCLCTRYIHCECYPRPCAAANFAWFTPQFFPVTQPAPLLSGVPCIPGCRWGFVCTMLQLQGFRLLSRGVYAGPVLCASCVRETWSYCCKAPAVHACHTACTLYLWAMPGCTDTGPCVFTCACAAGLRLCAECACHLHGHSAHAFTVHLLWSRAARPQQGACQLCKGCPAQHVLVLRVAGSSLTAGKLR